MLSITRADAEAIDRHRPLWLELHHHRRAVGGEALGPRGFRSAWPYMFRLGGRSISGEGG